MPKTTSKSPFLVTISAPSPTDVIDVAWKAYEGTWESLPDLSKAAPSKSGTSERIDLAPRPRDANYALRFTGFLDAPKDGTYTFTLASNDGARLSIGGAELIDNDHFRSVVESAGEVALKAGRHAFVLDYFQHSGFSPASRCSSCY